MKLKIIDICFSLIPALIVILMLGSMVYLIIENARLDFLLQSTEYRLEQKEKDIDDTNMELIGVKNDLVIWQNTAHDYKWKLEQSGIDISEYVGSEDE